jgi:hypothetical protein
MADADVLVLRITPLAPDSTASGLQTFLRQWATSIDEIRALEPTRDGLPTWVARIHTAEDKSKLPSLIQQKAFNRHPVRVYALPTGELRGTDPFPLPPPPMLFESEDCPIPFRVSDLRVGQKRVVPITRRPDAK